MSPIERWFVAGRQQAFILSTAFNPRIIRTSVPVKDTDRQATMLLSLQELEQSCVPLPEVLEVFHLLFSNTAVLY